MTLLIVAQVVDTQDPVLGFFVRWIEELAKHFERIEVICLKEGTHALPANVRMHSLGKERGSGTRFKYIVRFKMLAWKLRNDYDVVFVHMNQEYLLIAGWLWKFLGKRVYLWRNHYAGSLLTDVAAALCTKVFCTSKYSYTAKYEKTVIMPVGIDIGRFSLDSHTVRMTHSILFLARVSPSKRPELLIEALATLTRDNVEFTASFVGSPLPKDEAYFLGLKERVRVLGIENRITFHPAVPNDETPHLYRTHEIFVNTSPSGMLDKTIFEAAACGASVLASNKDLHASIEPEFLFAEGNSDDLAQHLKHVLLLSESERTAKNAALSTLALSQSVENLGSKLAAALRV